MQSTWSSTPTLNGLPIIGSMIPKKLLKQCWPNLEEFRGYRKLVTVIVARFSESKACGGVKGSSYSSVAPE